MAEEILYVYQVLFFFFQAEDGIRDLGGRGIIRSEEHTSELQSRSDLVCRLLLEKKKKLHFHFLDDGHQAFGGKRQDGVTHAVRAEAGTVVAPDSGVDTVW